MRNNCPPFLDYENFGSHYGNTLLAMSYVLVEVLHRQDIHMSVLKDCNWMWFVLQFHFCLTLTVIVLHRKIPNVSPGLIEVFKHFLGGLYSGGLIFGGAYIRRAFCVSVRVSRP